MKIAFLINTSWNIYNFRAGLIQHFIDQGHTVVAIAPRDDFSEKLEALGCEYVPVSMQVTGLNPVSDLRLIADLYKIFKEVKPDVVLSYTIKPNLYGSIAAGLQGIPCICNVSGLGTVFLWKGMLKRLAITLYRVAFRFNRWIFFQNSEDQEEFLEMVGRFREKTSLLPGSGVDISKFSFSPVVPQEKTVFLMISRLIVEKGVRDYVEAARLLKAQRADLEFRLVGGLDETHKRAISKEELYSWVDQGLITYKPHTEDIISEILESEVVVLPSYREGAPRTLLEAGAMGRALIATDVAGCRYVVDHGVNGFLCKLQDPQSLAQQIIFYLSLSKEKKIAMSHASRKKIENEFDEKLVIKRYQSKIDELVSS